MCNLTIDVHDIINKVRYDDLTAGVPAPSEFWEMPEEERVAKYREIFNAYHQACCHLSALDDLLKMYHE